MTQDYEALGDANTRKSLRIRGIVQGVGFRPYVFKLATDLGLGGFVRNDGDGAVVEVEGSPAAIGRFERELRASPPPLARIQEVTGYEVAPRGEKAFRIDASERGNEHRALVSPDVAICRECLAEIMNPGDRRFAYPFTNCTNCGPRFTITLDVPYDRHNTTMAGFAMCTRCAAEYRDPTDRRFHAQPIACPECGPRVRLTDAGRAPLGGDPIAGAARLLAGGKIVAVKGLGGWHLAADAQNESAVGALRRRKHREDKPFAVMAPDIAAARELCHVDEMEVELLTSSRRPVVLLRRRADAAVAESVAPNNRYLGVMLAYTPLHHLLLRAFNKARTGGRALVMTSGNVSDEPIAYIDDEAYERLGRIADYFLVGDRPIHIRCDDTVMRVFSRREYLIRRARGYAPEPVTLAGPIPVHILAAGAELKHTFAVAKDDNAFVSHHIGDLENWETMRSFLAGLEHFARIFGVRPEVVAYDLHPEYLSTKWAMEQRDGAPPLAPGLDLSSAAFVGVQHHHAHIASCLADNSFDDPVIGLALDGTGWGDDGTIWGCELLVADAAGYRRAGHLRTVPLPGGAAAIREPWRMGSIYLQQAWGNEAVSLDLPFVARNAERWGPVLNLADTGANTLPASSAGRLFDAAAALCGVRDRVNYEGQAAIEFEQIADRDDPTTYPCDLGRAGNSVIIDGVSLVRTMTEDLMNGAPIDRAAAGFHNGLVEALLSVSIMISEDTGLRHVALSGGTFQNLLLLERLTSRLERAGFTVLVHHRVPPNDGGISLGQVAVAAARLIPN